MTGTTLSPEFLSCVSNPSSPSKKSSCSSSPTVYDSPSRLWTELNRLRLRGICCNAVLATQDGAMFRVHKSIMSWCSDFFKTMFTTSLLHSSSGDPSVPKTFFLLPGVSSSILEQIIQYAYSGCIQISKDNINDLFPAADQLGVSGIVDRCIDFMVYNLSSDNCLGIWKLGNFYFRPDLATKARKFILTHFIEVSSTSDEFIDLEHNELVDIISDDYLNVPNEIFAWIAVKKWCFQKDRQNFLPSLLRCVRMPLMSVVEFQQIMDDPRVYRNVQCTEYIKLVSRYMLNDQEDLAITVLQNSLISMFTPRLPHDIILAIGGWSPAGPSNLMEIYDCRANVWKMLMYLNSPPEPRVYHQAAFLKGCVYVIGGSTGSICLRSCYCINLSTLKWEERSPMQDGRCFPSCAVVSNKIYVMGGYDGFSRLKTVEYFDPSLNQWIYVSPMNYCRSDASAAVLRQRIFVVGGFDGYSFLDSAECYYVEFDQWFLLPFLTRPRSGLGCVTLRNALYAVGGYDGVQRLKSVEKFCLNSNQWLPVKPMTFPRSNFGIVVLEKKIYVIGGYDDSSDAATSLNECFDPATNKWMAVEPLNVGRSGLCACLLSNLNDISSFVKENRFRCLLKDI